MLREVWFYFMISFKDPFSQTKAWRSELTPRIMLVKLLTDTRYHLLP